MKDLDFLVEAIVFLLRSNQNDDDCKKQLKRLLIHFRKEPESDIDADADADADTGYRGTW
jgi:hypothetical protein